MTARNFTEEEVRELVFENEVESFEGDSGRWTVEMETIVECDGNFYKLVWDCGLTECQESFFPAQESSPVERKVTEKLVEVVTWEVIEKEWI